MGEGARRTNAISSLVEGNNLNLSGSYSLELAPMCLYPPARSAVEQPVDTPWLAAGRFIFFAMKKDLGLEFAEDIHVPLPSVAKTSNERCSNCGVLKISWTNT